MFSVRINTKVSANKWRIYRVGFISYKKDTFKFNTNFAMELKKYVSHSHNSFTIYSTLSSFV